jgi:hypothetical protein
MFLLLRRTLRYLFDQIFKKFVAQDACLTNTAIGSLIMEFIFIYYTVYLSLSSVCHKEYTHALNSFNFKLISCDMNHSYY